MTLTRLLLVLLVGTASGCVPVAAWDRGSLAHPAMADSAQPDSTAFDAHLAGAREAALDPAGAGGGGCGCN